VAELEDHYQEVVPFAADKASMFLAVIRERGNEAGLGLTFELKQDRKSKQFTLEAPIQFKRLLSSGTPQRVVVFAEPVGQMLSVGWQLTSQGISTALTSRSDRLAYSQAKMDHFNAKPENVRARQAMLVGFHQMVFQPTLHQLVEAVERTRSSGPNGAGFLGA